MKKQLAFLILAVLALALTPFLVLAQVSDTVVTPGPFPGTGGELTIEYLLSWTNALYGALVIGFGYLSNIIPGINKIPKTVYRVAAIALILGGIFIVFGKTVPLALLFTYAGATSLYDLLLSLFKKTPNTTLPAPVRPQV
jgi:hypothetical protein